MLLSDAEIPLHESPDVTDYFSEHILRSLQDPTARAAVFSDALHPSFALCDGMFTDASAFVGSSRQLAERLCDLIAKDQRIAIGDLVVCQFRAGNYAEVPGFLGLLKLDPSRVFRHRQKQDQQGNTYVTLELDANALPTATDRLQKCAFVRPLQPRPDGYDMMLLDRQAGDGDPTRVAKFFAQDFLGVSVSTNPKDQTRSFYMKVTNVVNQGRADQLFSMADEEAIQSARDQALQSKVIDTENWSSAVNVTPAVRTLINAALAELPDREVLVDAGEASKLVQKRRFRGDGGLRVEVEADRYDGMLRVEQIQGRTQDARFRITIETSKWEEVLPR